MPKLRRDYVMVSIKHGTNPIQFWGVYSDDHEERTLGKGYTTDLDSAEKMTLEDIKSNCYQGYPIIKSYGEIFSNSYNGSAYIKLETLLKETTQRRTLTY